MWFSSVDLLLSNDGAENLNKLTAWLYLTREQTRIDVLSDGPLDFEIDLTSSISI